MHLSELLKDRLHDDGDLPEALAKSTKTYKVAVAKVLSRISILRTY